MANLLNNKKLLGILGVLVLVVVILGFFVVKTLNTSKTQQVNDNILPSEAPIPTIAAADLGLTLEAGPDKKTVILTVEKIEGITSIDYELSYLAKGDIPRGVIGMLDLKKAPATKEIKLGTCSDVCHYDTDVKDVKIVLKITKEDGSVYSSTVDLPSL